MGLVAHMRGWSRTNQHLSSKWQVLLSPFLFWKRKIKPGVHVTIVAEIKSCVRDAMDHEHLDLDGPCSLQVASSQARLRSLRPTSILYIIHEPLGLTLVTLLAVWFGDTSTNDGNNCSIPPTLDGWVYIEPIHGHLNRPLYTWAQYTPTERN